MTNEELRELITTLNNEAYSLDQAISLLQQEKNRITRMAAYMYHQLAIAGDTTADRQVSPEVVGMYDHMMPLLNKFKKEAGDSDNGGA